MRYFFSFWLIISAGAQAQEVIRPVYERKINLRIIRTEPDSFETYTLMNHNGREMTLVCAGNRVYDLNPKAIIRYRNFYGEEVADFTIEHNQVCLDMARFIESSHAGVDAERPFLIMLDTKSQRVERIEYPKLDPYLDSGDIKDLLPKERIYRDAQIPVPKSLH